MINNNSNDSKNLKLAKQLSDKLEKHENISNEEMEKIVNKLTDNELIELADYCLGKKK